MEPSTPSPFTSITILLPLMGVVSSLFAANWQTMADFERVPFTAVDALVQDAAGNLYAAVSSSDAERRSHTQVLSTKDRGTTWTMLEDFISKPHGATRFVGLAADAAGHIYACGYVTDPQGETRWIVKKSGSRGAAWILVDDFTRPGSRSCFAESITVDAVGNIYVAGSADGPLPDGEPGCRQRWLVRESRDGGKSWSVIDDYSPGHGARALAILSTSHGLFVAGSGRNREAKAGEQWLVRKGLRTGANSFQWQTVDEFQLQETRFGFDSRAQALAVDTHGNLYAAGRSYAVSEGANNGHWVVRRAAGTGYAWTTVDIFKLAAGVFAAASGMSAGPDGVFVVGRAAGEDSGSRWIVRHSATGEAGSWSVSDEFRPPAKSAVATKTAGFDLAAFTGSMQSSAENASGLAIVVDQATVFAAGSAYAGTGHALVRKLELSRATSTSGVTVREVQR